ncbi:MAG: thioredoxin family protein [Desulfuromonadaceae bacterium]|nr:thioredoxin family protein [Desulfuromonadaceae bacterium]
MKLFFSVSAIFLMFAGVANAELPAATAIAVNQALSSGKPTLIDFGLRTCNVCKKMAPYLESLSNDYRERANILFIDVRSDQATAQKFRVQMLPTQIFINPQGKEVQRHTGFMDKGGIIKGLKSAGLK